MREKERVAEIIAAVDAAAATASSPLVTLPLLQDLSANAFYAVIKTKKIEKNGGVAECILNATARLLSATI